MSKHLVLAAFFASMASGVDAHEFWIDPVDFQVAPGEQIVADFRVGEAYEGGAYSYIPHRTRRYDVAFAGEVAPAAARMGDRPAYSAAAPGDEGLLTIIHATEDSRITWDDFADFESFVRHKDAEWTLERHAERGLERNGTSEIYSRYAKSLIAVGDGAGADADYGLLTEIVALENPYTDDMSDGINVKVLYDGAPRAATQVEIFEKASDGTVTISTVRTDDEGVATVPVRPGHRYQLDSVVLREIASDDAGATWESLWANLTFQVP